MSFDKMKSMPDALKPLILLLTFLQIIFMASPGLRGFGWFICLTSILEFLAAIGIFLGFFFGVSFFATTTYSLLELGVSAAFCVCSALNTVYYFVNIFYLFNFWFLLATAASVLLVLAYGLQTLVNWSARGIQTRSTNQATAQPPPPPPGGAFPAGVNPA
ncbi:unnamed protein product [Caenorhabditis angaria]|uniref:MARVEL domain-containing protein n=1 Tax=Caenorhabditis angaria TaxID=860376 RepID=A0A9P1IDF1_9PELO|nr:unnamed protein product [Caenorhabditis angaria]